MPESPDVTTPEPAAAPPAAPPSTTEGTDKNGSAADSGAAPPGEPSAKELGEFARHRRGLQQKAKELKTGFAQLKAREREIAEKDAQRDKEIAELRARAEKWEKGNPLEHVADPNEVVRDYVEKTAPERRIEQIARENAELREKLAKLEKLPEEWEQKQAAERAKVQAAQDAAHFANERRNFTRDLRGRAKDFPYVHAEYEDAEIEAMAADIQAFARKNQRVITFEDAATYLNDRARKVYESKEERRKAIAPEPSGSGTERRDKKTPPGNGPRADRPAPATTRQARKLSASEEEAAHLQMIRDAQAKDRLASSKQNGSR